VIEELGHYDPMCRETDARAMLKAERIDYWLGVGAQPSDNVRVLIKKYGTNGTHLEQQRNALDRLKIGPQAPPPVAIPLPTKETPAAEAAAEPEAAAAPAEETGTEETPAAEENSAAENSAEEKAAEEKAAEEKPAEGEASE
jgi:small subunit ribosomal protein S16